jgi:hypothetical protein
MNEIDSPRHYTQGRVECIEAMEACSTTDEFCGHLRLTAMKYLWRLHDKDDPLKNTQKAKWYLSRLLSKLSSLVEQDDPNAGLYEFTEFLNAVESCSGTIEFSGYLRFSAMKYIWDLGASNNYAYNLSCVKPALWCLLTLEEILEDLSIAKTDKSV